MTVALQREWASVQPFGAADQRSDFTPQRIAIEKLDGPVVSERVNPRDSFAGHALMTPWDPLQRAYFNGYALWAYLTTPFLMTLPDFSVNEIDTIEDHGERWYGLQARFPVQFASHSHLQEFYFDSDFLLRRHDYRVDVAGGFAAIQYVCDMVVWLQFLHMWLGAFMLVGLVVSGVYAAGMLRGRTDSLHRLGFTLPFAVASVATLVEPLVGHVLGLQVSERQPAKLAAIELNPTTEQGPAALKLGGVLVDGHVQWALPIPKIGSIISRNSWDAPVPGLDTVPRSDWPPVNITHWSFQIMVGIGTLLAGVVVLFWLARRRGYDLLTKRWFLRLSVIAGPLAVLALESGWTATEVGRQPWTVWQVLRTSDAASMNTGLWWSYTGVLIVYLVMSVCVVAVVRSMTRLWRAGEEELRSAYAPESAPDPGATELIQ